MNQQPTNMFRAFLQGFTGAGLFRKLSYPGAPTEMIDSRSMEEIRATGEIEFNIARYREAKRAKASDDVRAPNREAGLEPTGVGTERRARTKA